jgi:hypothetical protein
MEINYYYCYYYYYYVISNEKPEYRWLRWHGRIG